MIFDNNYNKNIMFKTKKIPEKIYSISIYSPRAIKFFIAHPEAYNLIKVNINETNKTICHVLFEHNIRNKNKPYSLATISNLREFMIALDRNKLNDILENAFLEGACQT